MYEGIIPYEDVSSFITDATNKLITVNKEWGTYNESKVESVEPLISFLNNQTIENFSMLGTFKDSIKDITKLLSDGTEVETPFAELFAFTTLERFHILS